MDIALIIHADHGMNASTFASMVVASTLSDLYFSVGSGVAALNGPLHGGANEQVLNLEQLFGRQAPVVVEIGFGMGDSLIEMATQHPENNYLGIEVHKPGVGPVTYILVRGIQKADGISMKIKIT